MKLFKLMKNFTYSALLTFAVFSMVPLSASADELIDEGFEITREASDIEAVIRDQRVNPDVLDTALILTNQSRQVVKARCIAYDHSGQAMGRAWVRLPANGMRIFLASDIVTARNFVGSVRCKTRGHVLGSAFILGSAFSSAQVKNTRSWDESRISAPVVVAF